ncbi:hypothetical protein [Luteolibacter sp. Populi]|uniref:hypothetical protein n=1 Tax=Luteolibacter sp. Populi TaxID=3230487 RepID=UPI003464F9AA
MTVGKPYLLLITVGLGFAAGFAIHRGTLSASLPSDYDPPALPRGTSSGGASRPSGGDASSATRSTDTIPDLLAADHGSFAGRFSLWLIDASAEDIAAFWHDYRDRKPPEADHWSTVVMFRRWTQLDPEAAMAAAKRDGAEEAAIWGRAMHDPKAVLPAKPDFTNRLDNTAVYAVMRFNPDLALKMIEEDPTLISETDPDKLANEIAGDDPEKAMTFLLENGQPHLTEPLQRWTRDDPEGALAWMRLRWGMPRMRDDFLSMLSHEHPGMAGEMAADLPEGAMKRDLQQLAFRELLGSDPAAALAAARANPVPQPEQFAACARAMVGSDPQAALGLMIELFKLTPDAAGRFNISYQPPDITDSSEPAIEGPRELVGDLAAWDPAATMAAAMELSGGSELSLAGRVGSTDYQGGDPRDLIATAWMQRDPEAFAEWCNAREDQTLRNSGLEMAYDRFVNQERFPDALKWAMERAGEDGSADAAVRVFKKWSSKNQEEAATWLEETELPQTTREAMQETLKSAAP